MVAEDAEHRVVDRRVRGVQEAPATVRPRLDERDEEREEARASDRIEEEVRDDHERTHVDRD